MNRLFIRCILVLATWPILSGASVASTTCTLKSGSDAWVKKIFINPATHNVTLTVELSRTREGAATGQFEAVLESMQEQQFGSPIYLFNVYPNSGTDVLHAFKLFKVNDWRLINAGLVYVNGKPTLRAIEPVAIFNCVGSQ